MKVELLTIIDRGTARKERRSVMKTIFLNSETELNDLCNAIRRVVVLRNLIDVQHFLLDHELPKTVR